MQFFTQGKEDTMNAAVVVSMRSVKLCRDSVVPFSLEEHQAWYKNTLGESITVKVGEPEARGSYLKKHTTFLVTQEPNHYSIRRRFSDFEWLHTVLRARYIGMLIPSLPEKTTVLKSEAFIQSRIRGLQLFLQYVVQSPYLRSDAAVMAFFTKEDEKEWESAKKETGIVENAGAGHMRWLKRITSEHIPSSPENEIAMFKRHVEKQEKVLSDLVACTKRLADKSSGLSKDVGALHSLLLGWKATEATITDAREAEFMDLLEKSTDVIGGWGQVIRFQPSIYELVLHESIKYFYHQVKDMKELLAHRDQALHTAIHSSSDPVAATSSNASSSTTSSLSSAAATASSFASRFMHTEPNAAEVELQQQRARHSSDLITRALVAEEMNRFRLEKFNGLNELMNHFACAQAQLTKRSASLWRDYMKASSADSQELMRSTKQILDTAAFQPDEASTAEAY